MGTAGGHDEVEEECTKVPSNSMVGLRVAEARSWKMELGDGGDQQRRSYICGERPSAGHMVQQ